MSVLSVTRNSARACLMAGRDASISPAAVSIIHYISKHLARGTSQIANIIVVRDDPSLFVAYEFSPADEPTSNDKLPRI
eukprot:scaffold58460_cov18-Prasinocladus_malaysianus.AAC.1